MKNPFHSRLWILCLALTGVAALPTTNLAQGTNCFPAPTGLVGMWRGDGNTLDSGGTNNGTTPYGMAYAPGIVGQAFDFDSSSRRVSIPDQTAFRLTNSLTIEGWIFPRQYNSGFIFFRGDNRGGYDAWTVDMYQAGFLNFQIDDATNNYASLLAPIATNQWQHIAATLDGATGDMKIYINGVLISQTNTAVRPIGNLDPAYDPAVGIGNHGGSFHQFPFNGLIDEISLYSRALSQSEIQAIYSAGERGKCAPVAPSPSCVAAPAGL
ncbi:MAG TPA: LamG domain-containing protein, partial [Candidatus Paceibacterota bacterium]|nr:LamG domain-containing protein [Candidatus Paceibacterota bacterium]